MNFKLLPTAAMLAFISTANAGAVDPAMIYRIPGVFMASVLTKVVTPKKVAVATGAMMGLVGWRYYSEELQDLSEQALDKYRVHIHLPLLHYFSDGLQGLSKPESK
jgi:hypothetical protein